MKKTSTYQREFEAEYERPYYFRESRKDNLLEKLSELCICCGEKTKEGKKVEQFLFSDFDSVLLIEVTKPVIDKKYIREVRIQISSPYKNYTLHRKIEELLEGYKIKTV